jgi:creatinine amidohydrolase/Fe(II)-dependent formamide hydrolase-like protein
MGRKYLWQLMTWLEIRDAVQYNPPILIPMGTMETQGMYTFTGIEFVLAERLARATAEQTNALVLPGIPFGFSPHFEGIPGTISVQPSALSCIYEDITRSLILQGFNRLLFLAMHTPNRNILEQVAYKIRQEFGILITWINPGQLAATLMKEVSPTHPSSPAHGADPGLSLAMYFEPDITENPSILSNQSILEFQGLPLVGMNPSFRGYPLNMPLKISDVSPDYGGLGDPSHASAELGKALFEKMIEHLIAVVRRLEIMETNLTK